MAIALTRTYLVGPHKNPQGSDRIWFGSDRTKAAYYVTKVSFKVPAGFVGSSLSITTKGRNDYGGSTAMGKGKVYNFATTTVNVTDYSGMPYADTTFTTTAAISQNSTATLTATINKTFNANTTYYLYIWGASPSSVYSLLTHVSTELTLTGTYVVSYNANGGSGAPAAQNKTPGTALTLSSTKPTRTGYTFSKWNTKADGTGTNYNPGARYTTDAALTLYAIWTENYVRVAYNPNGGTVTNSAYGYNQYGWIMKIEGSVTYMHVQPYSQSYDPSNAATFGLVREGYNFDGNWYLYNQAEGITTTGLNQDTKYHSTVYYSYEDKTKTTANTSVVSCYLYAGWKAKTFTVSFDLNGGSGLQISGKQVTYDSTYGTLPTPSRTGYTFAGWFTAASGGTQVTASTVVKILANQTLYAHWTVKSYTYTLGSGTGVSTNGSTASGSKNYGTTITLKATANTGYTWSQWVSSNTSLVPNKSSANTSFTMPAGNITMTPSATANTYFVRYNGNGATSGSMSNSSHTYNISKALTANNFSRSGYEFIGWSTSTDGEVVYTDKQSVKNLSATNEATVDLYAIWKPLSQMFIWHDGAWHRALRYVYSTS